MSRLNEHSLIAVACHDWDTGNDPEEGGRRMGGGRGGGSRAGECTGGVGEGDNGRRTMGRVRRACKGQE